MSSTDVTAKLGWPGRATGTARGLGWPEVSRETDTPAEADSTGTIESEDEVVDVRQDEQAPLADNDGPPPTGPQGRQPAAEAAAGVETTGLDAVSRETVPSSAENAAEAAQIMTAAHLAENSREVDDSSTPLARATEHSIAVAAGKPVRSVLDKPKNTRVMAVANQKGGVGKTTTTVNVAAALAQQGLKVLVVDLDPQGNASTALSVEHSEGTPGAYGVLVQGAPLADVIVPCRDVPGLFVLPATIDLAGAEIELVSLVARETRLKRALDKHLAEVERDEERYDFVLIDCPPSLGLLTVNALSAGREMLIPIQCEYYALEGLSQLLRTIEQIREHLNPDLRVGAIMLTMFDARTRLAAGVAEEVREHFGAVVLKTAIPRSVRISEAPSYGQTVLTYDPGSTGSLSYLEAANELAQQAEEIA